MPINRNQKFNSHTSVGQKVVGVLKSGVQGALLAKEMYDIGRGLVGIVTATAPYVESALPYLAIGAV